MPRDDTYPVAELEALRTAREEAWDAMMATEGGTYERRLARAKWQDAKNRHLAFLDPGYLWR